MDRFRVFVVSVVWLLSLSMGNSERPEVQKALVQFMEKLFPGKIPGELNWGWNSTSDPCKDKWKGVGCDGKSRFVRRIELNGLNLSGTLDAGSLCVTTSLFLLSLEDNKIAGELPKEISNCRGLKLLYLRGNSFSGKVPENVSRLSNLIRFDISNNGFSGPIPELSRIPGLLTFRAQFNQLSGHIPGFDFSNLKEFNVSYNNLEGQIPDVNGKFTASSFLGNPGLCGKPLSITCPIPPGPTKKHSPVKEYLIYSGYAIISLVILFLTALKLMKCKKDQKENGDMNQVVQVNGKTSAASSEPTARGIGSEYSITSAESGMVPSSFVIISSQIASDLRFEDLLRAPAELIGRGKQGSTFAVSLGGEVTLAVKRIRDWEISRDEFERRMQRIHQVKHGNVMPVVAYYCSREEKLLVYEYQKNGSLFSLLHESQNGQFFDWRSRLNTAASIAEALAFMHERLADEGIPHGNLKSSNILFNKNLEPCISEYGLKRADNDRADGVGPSSSKIDICSYGVILLELLTGKHVQKCGLDLAKWVHSVVREEWTVEVFDKTLFSDGTNEERMVCLLQVALKCVDVSPEKRPCMREIATVIKSIKEDEENSISIGV